jgi:hypothetical protein
MVLSTLRSSMAQQNFVRIKKPKRETIAEEEF